MFSLTEKYLSIELKPDVFDENLCNITIIEFIEDFGKYKFNQKKRTIEKNKIEKISQEIINIFQEK